MAIVQDLGPFYRGEDLSIVFTMTPVTDITAWSILFRLKQQATDATPIATQVGTVTNASGGVFTVTLGAATTSVPSETYVYDVWRTDPGSSACLSIGKVQFLGSPSHP